MRQDFLFGQYNQSFREGVLSLKLLYHHIAKSQSIFFLTNAEMLFFDGFFVKFRRKTKFPTKLVGNRSEGVCSAWGDSMDGDSFGVVSAGVGVALDLNAATKLRQNSPRAFPMALPISFQSPVKEILGTPSTIEMEPPKWKKPIITATTRNNNSKRLIMGKTSYTKVYVWRPCFCPDLQAEIVSAQRTG